MVYSFSIKKIGKPLLRLLHNRPNFLGQNFLPKLRLRVNSGDKFGDIWWRYQARAAVGGWGRKLVSFALDGVVWYSLVWYRYMWPESR